MTMEKSNLSSMNYNVICENGGLAVEGASIWDNWGIKVQNVDYFIDKLSAHLKNYLAILEQQACDKYENNYAQVEEVKKHIGLIQKQIDNVVEFKKLDKTSRRDVILLYSQFCSHAKCEVEKDKYWSAEDMGFYSLDGGKTYNSLGVVLGINPDKEAFDSDQIWSGCVREIGDGKDVKFLLAYTGVSDKCDFHFEVNNVTPNSRILNQSIGFALSDDGINFNRIGKPVISATAHYDEMIAKGYFFGPKETLGAINEEDHVFMTLRDPMLVKMRDGKLHMFFGCKKKNESGKLVSAMGHALVDEKNLKVDLLPPIAIPTREGRYNQAELPNVMELERPFELGGKQIRYQMIASTTNHISLKKPDTEEIKTVRLFYSEGVDSGWFEPENGEFLDNTYDNLYGINVIRGTEQAMEGRPFNVAESYLTPPTYIIRTNDGDVERIIGDERDPEITANQLKEAAWNFKRTGINLKESEFLLERALDKIEIKFGTDNLKTAELWKELGDISYVLHNEEKAVYRYSQNRRILERELEKIQELLQNIKQNKQALITM